MFDFRIINTPDGNQVIDPSIKTPYDSLTPSEMLEYTEMDKCMAIMDTIARERRKAVEQRRKRARNPLHRFASMCGFVMHWP